MVRKNALGRGLGALIDGAEREYENPDSINEIEIKEIVANPWQPRSNFDEEALNELAESIKEIGIVQPITVRLLENGKYQIIAGERRFRAAQKLGLKVIPAFIREANDQNMLEMALVENIQREDLNAIDVAISYQRLIEECHLTQENMSDRVGKKRSTISNYLRLLRLPAEIQLAIKENKISMGHARAIISLDEKADQINAFETTIKKDLSVRKVEEFVRNLQEKKNDIIKTASPQPSSEYDKLKNHLSQHFGISIGFTRDNKGAGKIVIPFKSDEELEKIITTLDRLNA